MTDDLPAPQSKKSCAYCASEISAKAILCPVCNSYQSQWRTLVVYIASIAGLLGILGSAGVFMVSKIPDLYKVLAWNDRVTVWDFATGAIPKFGATISNTGDGSIILSKILIRYASGNVEYTIGRTLQPREAAVIVRELEPSSEYDATVANDTGVPNSKLRMTSNQIALGDPSIRPCFAIYFLHKEALEIKRVNEYYRPYGKRMVTEDAEAFVIYYSQHYEKEVWTSFPVVATFARSNRPECDSSHFED